MEVSVSENIPEHEAVETKRGRKKQLYQAIRSQMEFYFSASNLSKDRWVGLKLKEENGIHLTEFLKFNKIRALTQDVKDLAKALKKSEILSVTEDMKVNRNQPVKYKENEDDYIIYIEQLPSDANHEWLSGLFSKYGMIDYISIPKYRNSNRCKGFAFIEFSEVESAEKAIEYYKKNGSYLSTDIEPAGLASIATFEDPNGQQPVESESKVTDRSEPPLVVNEMETNRKHKSSKKRKNSDTSENLQKGKKQKTENFEEENKEGGNSEQGEVIATESEKDDANASNTEHSESITDESKKKKNRKKKSNKKNKNKNKTEETGLQILSKKDWKKLRNKYLSMQKEKMKQLKKHIVLARKKTESNKQNGLSKTKKNENSETNKTEKLSFSPGVIVKVKLNEPAIEVKNIKSDLKKNESLLFVDLEEGESVMHLRFASSEAALEFKENSSWPKAKILKGEKEANYWKKIQQQREEKLAKNDKKKIRGKDKLMRKAENILGKHITFD